MMAARRVVVIHDVGGLKKDARKALDAYLQSPAPDVLLLLTSPPGTKPDKLLSDLATPLQFDELTGDRLPKWVTHVATSTHGVAITPGAVELLVSSVGADLYQLSTELDKLASFTRGGDVNEAAVAAVVGITPGETLGDFLDALAERNLSKALPLVSLILSQPKTTGVSVVMALSTQTLALAWGRARLDEGLSRSRLVNEYFSMLKETGAYAGRSWGAACSAWARAAGNWAAEDITAVLEMLLDADAALKESRVSSEEQVIVCLLYTSPSPRDS